MPDIKGQHAVGLGDLNVKISLHTQSVYALPCFLGFVKACFTVEHVTDLSAATVFSFFCLSPDQI